MLCILALRGTGLGAIQSEVDILMCTALAAYNHAVTYDGSFPEDIWSTPPTVFLPPTDSILNRIVTRILKKISLIGCILIASEFF